MRASFIVTAAEIGDAEDLAHLHSQCFADGWSVQTFQSFLSSPSAYGCHGATACGAAPVALGLLQFAADEAEILTIGVQAGVRGLGFGRTVLDHMMVSASRLGVRRLFLEVATDNDAAMALYRSCGFVSVRLRKGYYSRREGAVDAQVMSCVAPLLRV